MKTPITIDESTAPKILEWLATGRGVAVCLRLPDGGTVQLEYSTLPGDSGRTRYKWTIDLPDGLEFGGTDLQSGCQGGSLQEGFESLLSFLTAAADSYRYRGMDWEEITEDDNASLFPRAVVEWAYQNSSELELLSLEIEENPELIIE